MILLPLPASRHLPKFKTTIDLFLKLSIIIDKCLEDFVNISHAIFKPIYGSWMAYPEAKD